MERADAVPSECRATRATERPGSSRSSLSRNVASAVEPEQAVKLAIARRAKPSAVPDHVKLVLTIELRRALAERLMSAKAIREGKSGFALATMRQLFEAYVADLEARGKSPDSVGRAAQTAMAVEAVLPALLAKRVEAVLPAVLGSAPSAVRPP